MSEASPGKVEAPTDPAPSTRGVTTVIPVYNGIRWLGETLDSLAAQSRPPDRVVVIDDASTDGTPDLVREYSRLDCLLRINRRNLGLFPNLNRSLELAGSTEFLHILHADDLVAPDFLRDMTAALEREAPLSLSLCGVERIDADGRVLRSPDGGDGNFRRLPVGDFLVRQCELRPVCCGAMVFRTGGKPLPCRFPTDYPHLADVIFYAELSLHLNAIRETPEGLCRMREHEGSMTASNTRDIDSWITDEWRAMRRIASLFRESRWRATLRRHRLRCLFAARSAVKEQAFRRTDPDHADAIRRVVREHIPLPHRLAGRLAVRLRDLSRGSGS